MKVNRKIPEEISDADFSPKLNITEKNMIITADFISKGVEDFHLPGYEIQHGYRLVKAKSHDHFRLITTDLEPETAYAVRLVHSNFIIPNRTNCTQVMIWRSLRPEHKGAVQGIAALFFNFFLNSYSIVVSDTEQTQQGRRFWEYRIIEALTNPELHVYVSDGTQGDKDGLRPLYPVFTDEAFFDTWSDFCWGTDKNAHSLRQFVISKEKIDSSHLTQ